MAYTAPSDGEPSVHQRIRGTRQLGLHLNSLGLEFTTGFVTEADNGEERTSPVIKGLPSEGLSTTTAGSSLYAAPLAKSDNEADQPPDDEIAPDPAVQRLGKNHVLRLVAGRGQSRFGTSLRRRELHGVRNGPLTKLQTRGGLDVVCGSAGLRFKGGRPGKVPPPRIAAQLLSV
jgi:hypothetical protein